MIETTVEFFTKPFLVKIASMQKDEEHEYQSLRLKMTAKDIFDLYEECRMVCIQLEKGRPEISVKDSEGYKAYYYGPEGKLVNREQESEWHIKKWDEIQDRKFLRISRYGVRDEKTEQWDSDAEGLWRFAIPVDRFKMTPQQMDDYYRRKKKEEEEEK